MTEQRIAEIIELVKKEVKPALGCTEPAAVSLAVARSCEALKNAGYKEIESIKVEVSANILKNGMGVGIPGTGMVGLRIAAALGATCGKSVYGLEVLKDLGSNSIDEAKDLDNRNRISILLAQTPKKLYIKATVVSDGHSAATVIEDSHDNISSVKLDGEELMQKSANDGNSPESLHAGDKSTREYNLSVKEIVDFAENAPLGEIEFILESVTLNKALAAEGLRGNYGLNVGRTIMENMKGNLLGDSLLTYAMAVTAAASDARMDGCVLPAMSNSGSGNQGITATLPVIAFAEKQNVDNEKLARALILSHLVAIHIKGYLGKLSALCGCVIASTGSSCGIVYLRGGGYREICNAIKNMVGNITGMVCDGAKEGCALKVASGVSSAIQSALLAMKEICVDSHDGIIDTSIEKTIENLGLIGSKGMSGADRMILEDKSLDYRVLDISSNNTFNDSHTSYWHKSIGGYSPAKMQRYQDLIEKYLINEINSINRVRNSSATIQEVRDSLPEIPVLSMLNDKYIILQADLPPVENPQAFGNCWPVYSAVPAATPDEEIALLGQTDLKNTAVIGADFAWARERLDSLSRLARHDIAPTDSVWMTSYEPNELKYRSRLNAEQAVIFSEIYYPKGWKLTIDGEPAELFRADWILRGAFIPAGEHEIVMRFEPQAYRTGEAVSRASSIALYVLLIISGCGLAAVRRKD